MIIYDIEIKKAIADKKHPQQPNIEYCEGWHDHKNMGISCICAYDYEQDRYRTFFEDNMNEFTILAAQADFIVGFNNIGFDNKVIYANGFFDIQQSENSGLNIDFDAKSYDILQEIWIADGLAPEFHYPSHIGYGLDNVVKTNFPKLGKTGHGAIAPIDFQRGNYGTLVDYCLADVWLTKKVLDLILETGLIKNPVGEGLLKIRKPA